MNIENYIKNIWTTRLARTGVMVVYDPDCRYRDMCMSLAQDRCGVVDSSESSIEAREHALAIFQVLGQANRTVDSLVVYVPKKRPLTDDERQLDPFSIYAQCGSEFPEGDGDDYLNLCLAAKPDFALDVRKAFEHQKSPDLAVINAIGGGFGWPNLQATLGVQSASDILFALLSPSPNQLDALKNQESWVSEVKELLPRCFGTKFVTRGKSWGAIADELWRHLLFSEFAFDLPVELPSALADVPHATPEARPLIEALCDRLRCDIRTMANYIERAEIIEKELNLLLACKGIEDFGVRDTFPFEERWFLSQTVEAIVLDDMDKVRQMIARHKDSVWMGRGESQNQWDIVRTAMLLIQNCDDAERILADHSRNQSTLIDYYTSTLRETDRCHREFEQVAGDHIDPEGLLTRVISQARSHYQLLMSKVQNSFVRHMVKEGWPPIGRLSNADVFDKFVAPKIQTVGQRVAYILVDALRFELGIVLERQLATDGNVSLHVACAQLPTITKIGMASLLPSAGQHLKLSKQQDKVVPMIGDVSLENVTQRMSLLRSRYGARFAEFSLVEFLQPKCKIINTVDLLVLRTNEIDDRLENSPESALSVIHDALKRLRAAVNELGKRGFHDIVIATDHGFFMNLGFEAGDLCPKPKGDWINEHDRALLGDGVEDSNNFVVAASHVGIRGDFAKFAGPLAMTPYRSNLFYMHGGASLQEAVVPVIEFKLGTRLIEKTDPLTIRLDYKQGAKRVTTRLPVVRVSVEGGDLFHGDNVIEFILEAHDKKGAVIGEARLGSLVNAATGAISMRPGESLQIPIKMIDDFEGKFVIKALDAATMSIYQSIELETDYSV